MYPESNKRRIWVNPYLLHGDDRSASPLIYSKGKDKGKGKPQAMFGACNVPRFSSWEAFSKVILYLNSKDEEPLCRLDWDPLTAATRSSHQYEKLYDEPTTSSSNPPSLVTTKQRSKQSAWTLLRCIWKWSLVNPYLRQITNQKFPHNIFATTS